MTDTKPAPPTLEQLQQLISRGPFNQWLNFTFIQADEAGIEIKATWRENGWSTRIVATPMAASSQQSSMWLRTMRSRRNWAGRYRRSTSASITTRQQCPVT